MTLALPIVITIFFYISEFMISIFLRNIIKSDYKIMENIFLKNIDINSNLNVL